MNQVLSIGNRQTMSSREIAEICGKKHRHVCRDIDNLNATYEKMGMPKVGHTPYINAQKNLCRGDMAKVFYGIHLALPVALGISTQLFFY